MTRVDRPDPAAIADAVTSLPSVSRLYGGRLAEIATHGPGQRILGVRLRDGGADEGEQGAVDVHIVVAPGFSPLDAAAAVHAEVAPFSRGRAVNVFVDDLDVDGPLPTRPALPPGSVAALPPANEPASA